MRRPLYGIPIASVLVFASCGTTNGEKDAHRQIGDFADRAKSNVEGVLLEPSREERSHGISQPELIGLSPTVSVFELKRVPEPSGEIGELDDESLIPISGGVPYFVEPKRNRIFELREVFVSSLVNVPTPSFAELGGVTASKARTAANPLSLDFPLVEAHIHNFSPHAPPEIKVYDIASSELVHHLRFKPDPYSTSGAPPPPQKFKIPVYLAYDRDPWTNTDKEPRARSSRVELHFGGKVVDTLYAGIQKGVWVLPVAWQNLVEEGEQGKVDVQKVTEIFWTPAHPDSGLATWNDVNKMWRKAKVQFRLNRVLLRVVPKGESRSNRCTFSWDKRWSVSDAVDVFAIHDLFAQNNPTLPESALAGFGCYPNGFVVVSDRVRYNGSFRIPGFSGSLYDRAHLVAHELGHYIGAPVSNDSGNLMYHPYAGALNIEDVQVTAIKKRLKEDGYGLSP